VQTDLEDQGFQVQCIVIPASGIGAWHQRKRVWIIACNVSNSNSNRNSSEEQRSNGKENSFSQEHRQKFSTSWEFIGTNTNDVPNSNSRLSIRENEEIQTGRNAFDSIYKSGERQWWETESKLRGIPDGVSYELDKDRSGRIKSLGNSIVPQIARQLGLSIMEAELGLFKQTNKGGK
jgi:DNA (cytosine-5)-methyltransferase 1